MRRSAIVGLFALFASLSTAAFADTSPWYVGLAAERSDYSALPEAATDVPGASQHANGWSVLGGYQFNTWFGLEASYFDLGSVTANSAGLSLCCSTGEFDQSFVSKPKLTGESLDAVLKLDLAYGFFVFGKGGLTRSDLDQPVVTTDFAASPGQSPTTTVSSSDSTISSTVFDYGIGLGYATESGWTLRLGWTQYHNVGDTSEFNMVNFTTTGGQGNVNSLHLDLLYHF